MIAYMADVGQGEDGEAARAKALKLGAKKVRDCHCLPLPACTRPVPQRIHPDPKKKDRCLLPRAILTARIPPFVFAFARPH